jgi:hypothetical protein
MKRIATVLSIVATSLFLSAAAVISAENGMGNEKGKDVCLLVSMKCADNVDTIQQRIERLNKEIAKGTDVYTRDELRNLNIKLENAVRDLEALTTGS